MARKKAHRKQAPRSMWRGAISFGLVNVPVRLQPAVRPNDVHFHMLHDQDKSRLQRKMVCPVEEKEVPYEHIIKGYEVSPGRHVVVEERELEALAPKASRAIEVLYFADLEDIDPLYFQHPYYLVPEEGSEKAFHLFVEAMAKTRKVAIVRFVMRGKEYLAAVRAVDEVLLLETMYFKDEIVPADGLVERGRAKITERELKVAEQLIESLTSRFEPEKLHDEYREAVLKLVEKKASGEKIELEPEHAPKKTQVADILAALEESLAQARSKRKQPAHA
jgi:DNA end-binding protein Ku